MQCFTAFRRSSTFLDSNAFCKSTSVSPTPTADPRHSYLDFRSFRDVEPLIADEESTLFLHGCHGDWCYEAALLSVDARHYRKLHRKKKKKGTRSSSAVGAVQLLQQ